MKAKLHFTARVSQSVVEAAPVRTRIPFALCWDYSFNTDCSKNLAECIFGFQVCLSSADLSLRVSCQLHPSHALRMVCAQPASGPFLGKDLKQNVGVQFQQ